MQQLNRRFNLKLQLRTVNRCLRPLNIELCKGEGYFYFTSPVYNFKDSMVMVNTLNQLTLDEWLNEAIRKINVCKEN
jgi:hypothetical protein